MRWRWHWRFSVKRVEKVKKVKKVKRGDKANAKAYKLNKVWKKRCYYY